nr:hypothetical protein [uncultured Desulfobulbus sp.]
MEILSKPIPELPGMLEPYATPQLPDVAQKNHVAPNTFLQSAMFGMVRRGHRKYLERHKIVSFRNVSIYFTGGSLDQGDLDVILHAMHLAAQQAVSSKTNGLVEFSVRGFLKALNKKPGKSGQDWLFNSIRRLCACLVEVQYGDKVHQPVLRQMSIYGGPLIYDFYHDSVKKKFFLRVNADLGSLLDLGWTSLEWRKRLGLRNNLAKWLHGLYGSTELYPLKTATICQMSRSTCKELYKFRQQLKKALNELVEIEAIGSWNIDAEDKVHVFPRTQSSVA